MDEHIKGLCMAGGCERIAVAKGFCSKHYQHFRTWGHPTNRTDGNGAVSIAQSRNKTCKVPDCDRDVQAKGLCSRHYQKSRYDPNFDPSKAEGFKSPHCIVLGCEKEAVSRGMCMAHYQYKRTHPEFNPQNPNPIKAGSVDKQGTLSRLCSVMACASRVHSMGLCQKHYYRKIHNKPVMTLEEQHYQECQMDVRTADPENPRWHMLHNPDGWDKYGEGDDIPLFAKDLPQEAPSANSSADTLDLDPNALPFDSTGSTSTSGTGANGFDTPAQGDSDGFDSLDERESAPQKKGTVLDYESPVIVPSTALIEGWSLEEPTQAPAPIWEPTEPTEPIEPS